jgi:hypothetical protein
MAPTVTVRTTSRIIYLAESMNELKGRSPPSQRCVRTLPLLGLISEQGPRSARRETPSVGSEIDVALFRDVDERQRHDAADRLEPKTMTVTPMVKEPGYTEFDNATSTVQVGHTLWFGTYAGDRMAYRATQ